MEILHHRSTLNPLAPEFFPSQLHKLLPPTISLFPSSYFHLFFSSFQSQSPYYSYPTTDTTLFPFSASITTDPSNNVEPVPEAAGSVPKQAMIPSSGRRTKGCYVWRPKGEKQPRVVVPNDCNNKRLENRWVTHHAREEYRFRRYFLNQKKRSCCPVVPVRVDGDQTTVMIKNIPSKYTRDMLVNFLEEHCRKENGEDEETVMAFDFVYLPIDFKSGMNKGYAFVNFTEAKGAWKFLLTSSNRKWDLFQSHKIREVVAARLQGKESLEKHFQVTSFPCESDEVLPVSFSPPRDGVTKGSQRTIGRIAKRQ